MLSGFSLELLGLRIDDVHRSGKAVNITSRGVVSELLSQDFCGHLSSLIASVL